MRRFEDRSVATEETRDLPRVGQDRPRGAAVLAGVRSVDVQRKERVGTVCVGKESVAEGGRLVSTKR